MNSVALDADPLRQGLRTTGNQAVGNWFGAKLRREVEQKLLLARKTITGVLDQPRRYRPDRMLRTLLD